MAKITKKVRSAAAVADDLEVIRMSIADKKKIERNLTAELLNALHAEHINEAGNYQMSKTKTLKIADEKIAMEWAKPLGLLKVDTTGAKEHFRRNFENPEVHGFAVVESERIVPKGGKDEDDF